MQLYFQLDHQPVVSDIDPSIKKQIKFMKDEATKAAKTNELKEKNFT